MNPNLRHTIRELAVEVPGATRVFEKLGIDYCCSGEQLLDEACAAAGVTADKVIQELELATFPEGRSEELDFREATFRALIDHIVKRHHSFTRNELFRLQGLIENVCAVHKQHHPELIRVRSIFQTLSSELEPHMLKEEVVLFPYLLRMEEAERDDHVVSTPPFRTVAHPISMMTVEHEGAGYLLRQLRQITSNYTPPSDACASYKTLYQALEGLEKDLHEHIHLENNILFPRALTMEIEVIEPGATV